jgi:hypothetical protein
MEKNSESHFRYTLPTHSGQVRDGSVFYCLAEPSLGEDPWVKQAGLLPEIIE